MFLSLPLYVNMFLHFNSAIRTKYCQMGKVVAAVCSNYVICTRKPVLPSAISSYIQHNSNVSVGYLEIKLQQNK